MAYYNLKRTIESMVLPFAFIAVVEAGIPDEFADQRKEMVELFTKAAEEAYPPSLRDANSRHPDILKRRGELLKGVKFVVINCITNPAQHFEHAAAKAALILYYFLQNMIEQGAYQIQEGSSFDIGLQKFLPTVEPWLDERRFDKSAFKESRRMLERMHKNQYFTDVTWGIEFE